jgi:hypothetical protein
VKLTNKSDSIQKKEDVPQVLKVEIVENEANRSQEAELRENKRESSPAYSLGQMVGSLGFFILGLLKSKKASKTDEAINRREIACPGKRIRRRRG